MFYDYIRTPVLCKGFLNFLILRISVFNFYTILSPAVYLVQCSLNPVQAFVNGADPGINFIKLAVFFLVCANNKTGGEVTCQDAHQRKGNVSLSFSC